VTLLAKTNAAPNIRPCTTCGHPNELPFIFCGDCGAPRVSLGKWRVTMDLALVLLAFLSSHLFSDMIAWNWPLYALYAVLFLQFTEALAQGRLGLQTRIWAWCGLFILAFAAFFEYLHREGPDTYIWSLTVLPQVAGARPILSFALLLAAVALIFVPLYLRWARVYGWVNAYRLVLLGLIAICLAALGLCHAISFIQTHNLVPSISGPLGEWSERARPLYQRHLLFAALMTGRLFGFELLTFSAVRGFAIVRRSHHATARAHLRSESAFVRSVVFLVDVGRQVAESVINMGLYLTATLWALAADLAQILLTFVREFLGPVVVLSTASVLLYFMSRWTDTYIEQNTLGMIARMVGGIAGLILCSLIFLGCKTDYRWGRVIDFYVQLMSWLLPNLLVFFLLLSLSLWVSSVAYHEQFPDEVPLPFHLGLLTRAVAILLAALVTIVVIRKRSLIFSAWKADASPLPSAAAAPEVAVAGSPTDAPLPEAAPHRARPWRQRPRLSLMAKPFAGLVKITRRPVGAVRRVMSRARVAAEDIGLDRRAERVLGTVRDLRLRVKGKPLIVEELTRAKQRYAMISAKVEALESTRESISPETYDRLARQNQREILAAMKERDRLQARLDRECEENLVKKSEAEANLAALQAQRAELERLLEAGAVDQREFKRRRREIDTEIESAQLRLESVQRVHAFLASEASAEERPIADERRP
jgi:hypothetical protein